jgi:hypothetical protein
MNSFAVEVIESLIHENICIRLHKAQIELTNVGKQFDSIVIIENLQNKADKE